MTGHSWLHPGAQVGSWVAKWASKWASALALWLLLALTWVLAHLPRSFIPYLGDLGGLLFYQLSRRRRSIALDNIQKAKESGALPSDLDAAYTAKKSFKNLGRTAVESFCLLHRGFDYFKGCCQFEGLTEPVPAIVESTKETGRGVIFLTAHSGNWEISPAAVSVRFNFKVSVVGRSQGHIADQILSRIRSQGGGEFIYKDGGARTMLTLLKNGGFLGTLFDQAAVVGSNIAELTFMGRPAMTTLGPVRLAAKTGAAVVPFFCRREGRRHIFEFVAPIFPPQGNDREWLNQSAQKLNDQLADFIRRYPDQWMWSHRRWKMPDHH